MTEEITAAELASMVGCAEEFHRKVKYPGKFNPAAFVSQWEKLLSAGMGHVFAMKVDGETVESIGLLVVPDYINGDKVASVAFWYVGRKSNLGAMLYFDVEAWCRVNGVSRINCSARVDFRFMPMYRFLSKLGYAATEATFQKELIYG